MEGGSLQLPRKVLEVIPTKLARNTKKQLRKCSQASSIYASLSA